MVLNGTSPQADGYGNAAIDSGDSYSFSQNSLYSLRKFAARIEIPPYGMGKQLLFLRSQPAYEEYMASRIKQHLEMGMALVDRPLTQQETDSFVEQAVSLTTKPRMGAYLGTFAGFLIIAKPFIKNGRLIPTSQIKGMIDRQLIVKIFLWPFCIVAGNTFGKASGASLAVRDLTTDPRLSQYRQDRANQDPQKVQKSLEKLGFKSRAQQTPRHPSSQQNMPDQDKDASPNAGFESTGYGDSTYSSSQYGSSNENNGIQSQSYSQILGQTNSQQWDFPQQQQQQQRKQQQQQGSWSTYRQGHQGANKNDNEDVFDLNSNATTPSTRSTATGSQTSGSAWDRLRGSSSVSTPSSSDRENSKFDSPTASTENTSPDSSPASSGGSWDRIRSTSAFPSSAPSQPQTEQWPQNQQDNYAESTRQSKDKAQREFDRLLEKERQNPGDADGYTKHMGAWGKGS
ncbi:hypothetical protein EMCG_05851 [[Emmonsia] crescens]|uniref:Uncharacterized protein n=1 Tax=[Emmonsia] crescens TaxID=73230 RepID=A0A0G2ICW0_9EURO|nr:hypothetical protein EMCG_05851 [Emmonsia crescens UAMH 3008]